MNIRTDQVDGFFTFFFHHHDGHFPQALEVSNKPGDLEGFGLSIYKKGDLSIGRNQIQKACDAGLFPIPPENRIGFELRNHMVTTPSTDLSQRFGPVPAIGQDIEFARDWQHKGLDDLFCQGDFGLKGTATPRPQRIQVDVVRRIYQIVLEPTFDPTSWKLPVPCQVIGGAAFRAVFVDLELRKQCLLRLGDPFGNFSDNFLFQSVEAVICKCVAWIVTIFSALERLQFFFRRWAQLFHQARNLAISA